MSTNSGLITSNAGLSLWQDKILPALLITLFSGILLFFTGFAETPALHNAAHDGRHSAGFPCH